MIHRSAKTLQNKAVVALSLSLVCGCGTLSHLTTTEATQLITTDATITDCESRGESAKDAGSPDAYGVYDNCMREAGLH